MIDVGVENGNEDTASSRRIRRRKRRTTTTTITSTITPVTAVIFFLSACFCTISCPNVDVDAFNTPAPLSLKNQPNHFFRLHARSSSSSSSSSSSTTTTRLSKDVSLSSSPSSSPSSPDEKDNSYSSSSSPSSSVSTGYDRQEYEMQIGRAMDTLRNDYPDFLHCKDPDYSIYSMDLELIDPSGVHLHGVKNYKKAIHIVHTLLGIFYCPQESTVQFRMCFDKARHNIRISWNAEVIPKALFGGTKRVLHVDGISIYELDRMSGNITQHRLERLVMNDDLIQEEQGIFAALRSHAIQSQRDHGRVIGIPALSGMDDMLHPITGMDVGSSSSHHHATDGSSRSINSIPNQILRFKNNKNSNQRSLLFDDDSDTTASLSTSTSCLHSHNMGDANSMAMMNMNTNDPDAALKKKNLLRRKFGLKPIDMKEFVELEANIAELDYQQQQKKKEADVMAAIEAEQRMKKQRQQEIKNNSGLNSIFQKLFGDVVKDTCESNYDCQRPEVCCDMGFKKMCCSNGMRIFNAPNVEGVLVPVTISPTPDPTIPPNDPRNNQGYY